jgi:Raf kinase inhibitor-like YbhB/YbcL family protein
LLALGCAPAYAQGRFSLHSPAYHDKLAQQFTCDGAGISPPLQWSHLPRGTKSLAFVLKDPDAPNGTFIHWVVYDIPADADGLPKAANESGLPRGARLGTNTPGKAAYFAPCPPTGSHRYVHELFALDTVLADLHHPGWKKLRQAMHGHVLGKARLSAAYARH